MFINLDMVVTWNFSCDTQDNQTNTISNQEEILCGVLYDLDDCG